MNTFFGQTFVCLIVMLKNKTRAIEDINISIALVDSWVRPLIGQCKLNDIGGSASTLFCYTSSPGQKSHSRV
jgi:hypothetical protein